MAAPVISSGQVNRYVVFFKDKSGSPYSVNQPEQFLSAKSIERRTRQQLAPATPDDIPVNSTYVSQVKAKGAKTFFTSRWLNCLLIESTEEIRQDINSLPFVDKSTLVAPGHKLSNGRSGINKRLKQSPASSITTTQLEMLGINEMQAAGYKGEGITIAVFDSGFDGVNITSPFAHLFQNQKIKYTYDMVRNTSQVYGFDDHGTGVLSTMAAYVPDFFTGGTYEANFQLYITEDSGSEYRVEEFNWLFAAERADSAGVDVITSSLGYNTFDDNAMNYTIAQLNGSTTIVSQAAQRALAKGIIVVCSAGNEGNNSWRYITAPADVQGILATGAVTANETRASFSSIGPTSDNRIKPDVMALGTGVSIITPNGSPGTSQGTSFSAPLMASLAAGVWQAFPYLTAREVYDAIIHSADQATHPDNLKGYGIPHFISVKNYIESSALDDEVFLSPNPASSSVRIELKNPDNAMVTISVFDTQGKLLSSDVISITWQNNPIEYDVSDIAAGIYLFKVKSDTFLKTIRLVKL